MTEPSEFPVGLGNQDGGAEYHSAAARRLDVDLKAGTDTDLALHELDKRIPLGVSGEIREHSPNLFARGIDLDLGRSADSTASSIMELSDTITLATT